MHLWSPRRGKSNAVKRSMSSPTTALVTGTPSSRVSSSLGKVDNEGEETAIQVEEEEGEEGDKRSLNEVARQGMSAARNALMGSGTGFGGEGVSKARRGKMEEGWAPGLFYAYARRTNLPNSSRYILTFSSAKTCQEWWNLVQSEFGGLPTNTRESAQLFSFSGDDMPGRAWKNPRFDRLKTKWFYTQLGDAVGTTGRGMDVLPLQDEKGWSIGVAPAPFASENGSAEDSAVQRRASYLESLNEMKGRGHERRWSKRDSGIILMSPFSEHFKSAEEASKGPQIPEDTIKVFDFERMEKNLEKVEKMMEQNAQQMRGLEHIQAANLERLTAALLQNVEMVQELARGQEGLVHACEELRVVVDKRDKREESDRAKRLVAETAEREKKILEEKADRDRRVMAEKAEKKIAEQARKEKMKIAEMAEMVEKAEKERRIMAAALEKLERQSRFDQEERDKRSRPKEVGEGQHLTRSQSIMSTATQDTFATLSPCGHVVGRAPRKLGRQVVGYIYANDERHEVVPTQRDKRKVDRG